MNSINLHKKILIVTAVWQRHELTEIVLSYYAKLAQRSKGKIQLLAAGSEGVKSRTLCERNGWNYIECPNDPVSFKWSTLTQEARNFDFDFLTISGSDDLLSLPLIRYYDSVYSSDAEYMLGLKDLYFYMMSSEKSYHFHGYETLKTIGAGRCFSRTILKKVNWKPWHDYAVNRGLDSRCSSHLIRCGITERPVRMKVTGGIGIDIKHHKVAITEESRIISVSTKCGNIFKSKFPEEYAAVKSLMIPQ